MPLRTLLKLGGLLLLVAGAVTLAALQFRSLGQTGDAGARVWFYDESAQRLYAAPADTIPPHKGTSGRSGDGVRAVVVTMPGHKQRVAYLETYSPELKAVLEEVHKAHAAKRPFAGRVPARDSDFFQTNTLVRRVDESVWHPSNSPEALAIQSEWRTWGGPGAPPPAISTP